MTLGERLTALRKNRGMSQDALAETLGVSRQSVSKWETDTSVPDLDNLVRLSDLFAVTLDELVRGKTPDFPRREQTLQWRAMWEKLRSLYREKAYLAGWLLLFWGGKRAWSFLRSLLRLQEQATKDFDLWAYVRMGLLPTVLPCLVILFGCGAWLLVRGRSGSFRAYHLGWVAVLASLVGIRSKTFLNQGILEEVLLGTWMTLRYGQWWELPGIVLDELFKPRTLVLAAGVAVLVLGKKRAAKPYGVL